MTTMKIIELPSDWKVPEGTLEPLLDQEPPASWLTVMNFVCSALREVGNDEPVVIDYRDQALSGDFSHLVEVSMAFMGELETASYPGL
jgi:hypothetical protein